MLDPAVPAWSLPFLIAALALALYFSFRSYALVAIRRKKTVLFFLRTLAAVFLLALILRPTLKVSEAKISPGTFAVLVDQSASMSLKSQNATDSRYGFVSRALPNLAKGRLSQFENQVIEYFGFGKEAFLSTEGQLVEEPKKWLGDTDVLEALRATKEKVIEGAGNLNAIFLFSDGADRGMLQHEWKSTSDVASLSGFGIPVFTFAPGQQKSLKDLRIREVRFNNFGFIKTPMTVAIDIEMEGFPEKEINVSLYQGRDLLTSQNASLKSSKSGEVARTTLTLTFSPKDLGDQIFSVRLPSYEEEDILENNRKSFIIRIIRDKIRVLHVSGRPSWDVKFLRLAMKSDPNIDLIAFYILRNREDVVDESDQSELSLIPFPHHELFGPELKTFDAVIFQNFNYTQFFPAAYIANVKNYVENGGGFWMLGGENSFGGGNYQNTPLLEVLPFNFSSAQFYRRNVKMALTPRGEKHPITRLMSDPTDNRALWDRLPEIDTVNPMSSVKPEANVLVKSKSAEGWPILATLEAGKGRTLAFASESLWKLQFSAARGGGGAENTQQLIKNAIRYLVGDPTEALVDVELKKNLLQVNDRLEAVVKAKTRNYDSNRNAVVEWSVEGLDEGKVIEKGTGRTDDDGRFSLSQMTKQPGSFLLRAVVKMPEGAQVVGQAVFIVEGDAGEWVEPRIQDDLLKRIAEKTGGMFFELPSGNFETKITPKFSYDVVQQKKIPLFKTIELFFCLFFTWIAEWIYRRRLGLS